MRSRPVEVPVPAAARAVAPDVMPSPAGALLSSRVRSPLRSPVGSLLPAFVPAFVVMALLVLATGAARAALPHHDLEIRLDPDERQLIGTDTLRLDPPRAVTLTLGLRFAVVQLRVDGKPVAVDRNVPAPSGVTADGLRRIPVPAGARVEIEWRGTLDPLDESLAHRDTLSNARPVAAARGSFLPSQSGWYPGVAGTLQTYRATLDVPGGQRALVPGRIVDERESDGRYHATFDFPHPARGIDLVAGPWRVDARTIAGADGRPVELRTYFHAEIAELAPGYLDSVAGYMQRYAAAIGPYPFGLFSVVSSPTPTGFGMPGFTYLGIQVLRLPFIRATSLGHEVLHNWIGNGIYPDYATGNWSEGLTTFLADYAYAEERGATEAWHERLAWLQEYASIGPADDLPLAKFTARSHGASQTVGYGKTAMVFLMLRDQIGREAFERGLRRLWERERFRVAGWRELRAAFEEASGRDLRGFFTQWVERAGAPAVRLAGAPTRRNGRIEVTLEQGSPPYALRVPLRIGERTELAALSETRQTFTFDAPAGAPGAALPVTLDPDLRVFRRLARGEGPPLMRQVTLARDVGLFVASPGIESEARTIATRLAEHGVRDLATATEARAARTLVAIALERDLAPTLAALGVTEPREVAGAASRAWAAWAGERLVLVVTARDREGLAALARPLPFHARQGYVTFDGARAVLRGVAR